MKREEILRWIEADEINKDSLLDQKFDDAIVGINEQTFCFAYDSKKIYDILKNENMNDDEILEYMDNNFYKKDLKTTFISFYNKENVDNFFWFKEKFSFLRKN